MPLFDKDYLRHIYDEVKYISEKSESMEFEKFIADETFKRAFIRSIEIIGEASKKTIVGI